MIKCPECGKPISSDAWECPQCGNPIKKRVSDKKKKRTKITIILLIVLILGIAFGIYAYKASEKTDKARQDLIEYARKGRFNY